MRRFAAVLWVLVLACPFSVRAASGPDLMIVPGYIHFSPNELISGEQVRLYARVRNDGDVDATAQVLFYVGSQLIGTSQPVSVLAEGGYDDVYIDALVPDGSFNVLVRVGGSTPAESNTANNEVLTAQFVPEADVDRDGIPDGDDNCPGEPNDSQRDIDQDGKGDACDSVDDRVPQQTEQAAPPAPAPVSAPAPTPAVVPVGSPAASPPAPLAGEQVASAPPAPAPSASPGTLASLFSAAPTLSPRAQFSYVRDNWRTITFTAMKRAGERDPVALAWDFGDGTTSARAEVTHSFASAGSYVVTLAVTDEYGTITSDTETVVISFFHLNNPVIVVVLAVLMGLLSFLGLYLLRLRTLLRRTV